MGKPIITCHVCHRERPHAGRGLCGMCWGRAKRGAISPPLCGWPGGCESYPTDGDRCQTHAHLEDALWLLRWGESPERVAERVGLALSGLAFLLANNGYKDTEHHLAVSRAYRRQRVENDCRTKIDSCP